MLGRIKKSFFAIALLAMIMVSGAQLVAQNRAPDFSLRAVNGPEVTADTLRGEVVVLAFGASWLPLTQTQMEGLKKLADQYAAKGVFVYWVSTESESPKSKNYVADDRLVELGRKYKLTVLRDPDGAFSKKLGCNQIPSIVILDKQGNVSGAPIEGMDPNASLASQLAPRLDKLF